MTEYKTSLQQFNEAREAGTTIGDQIRQTTADKHIATLRDLAEHCKGVVDRGMAPPLVIDLFDRRVRAIDWILSLNAYGVTDDEVVT